MDGHKHYRMAITSVLYNECIRRRCVTKKCNVALVEFYNNRYVSLTRFRLDIGCLFIIVWCSFTSARRHRDLYEVWAPPWKPGRPSGLVWHFCVVSVGLSRSLSVPGRHQKIRGGGGGSTPFNSPPPALGSHTRVTGWFAASQLPLMYGHRESG